MEALSPAGALPPLTAIMEIAFGVIIVFGVIIPAELELIILMELNSFQKLELNSCGIGVNPADEVISCGWSLIPLGLELYLADGVISFGWS